MNSGMMPAARNRGRRMRKALILRRPRSASSTAKSTAMFTIGRRLAWPATFHLGTLNRHTGGLGTESARGWLSRWIDCPNLHLGVEVGVSPGGHGSDPAPQITCRDTGPVAAP